MAKRTKRGKGMVESAEPEQDADGGGVAAVPEGGIQGSEAGAPGDFLNLDSEPESGDDVKHGSEAARGEGSDDPLPVPPITLEEEEGEKVCVFPVKAWAVVVKVWPNPRFCRVADQYGREGTLTLSRRQAGRVNQRGKRVLVEWGDAENCVLA